MTDEEIRDSKTRASVYKLLRDYRPRGVCHGTEKISVESCSPDLASSDYHLKLQNTLNHHKLAKESEMIHSVPALVEILLHPLCSPDLASSEFYLFRSLQNSLNGKTSANGDQNRAHVQQFLARKPEGFYRECILGLPKQRQKNGCRRKFRYRTNANIM